MLHSPETIRVIVYDLDGTVYDDNRHFELYAREIASHLPTEVQDGFWRDYRAVVDGHHPALRIGAFYDRERDLVLYTRANQVTRALRWDGTPLTPEQLHQIYPGTVEPDHSRIYNVGDLWWVPSAVSAHYGGDPAKQNEAFLRIRELMAGPSFTIRAIPGLREAVESLKGRVVQVLATNSPQPDSEAILTKIGLLGHFDRLFFKSNKPMGLKQIFDELAQAYNVQLSQLLSVGDNLVNEIAPAKAMGCQTVFIDPHELSEPDDADLIVRNMAELLPVLRSFGQA